MRIFKVITVIVLYFGLIAGAFGKVSAQTAPKTEVFDKIEMLSPDGSKIREIDVRIHLKADALEIESVKSREIIKKMSYSEIRSAEYSYTKNPRWKTALGLGATAVIFPPILLVAIPLGFTKHRRHWLTVNTGNDYAVLKLSKGTRKVFMPSFETHAGIRISGLGEDK
jgi:hypothetical protein